MSRSLLCLRRVVQWVAHAPPSHFVYADESSRVESSPPAPPRVRPASKPRTAMTELRVPDKATTTVPFSDPIAPLRVALRSHYEILRQIGQGAYATVYLARDLKHERQVAIKVLNADPTSETGELRFIREIRTIARLQHPNILPLHDSGHVEALLYYVMPYVSGDTLRDRIDRERQLPIDDACNIARDVADALAYAHGEGVIHRDIKPENILLSTGHPILADFGIARIIDLAGVRQLTRTGTGSPGTPAYMSPEQLLGDRVIDARSDTYSLGCVVYEMLAGKPPFGGKEGFVKRFTEPPPKVSSVRSELPRWLDDVIERALQRDPARRFQSAREFAFAVCPPAAAAANAGSPSHQLPVPAIGSSDAPESSSPSGPRAPGSEITVSGEYRIKRPPKNRNALSNAGLLVRRFPARFALASLTTLVLIAALASSRGFGSGWRQKLLGTTPHYNSAEVLILPLRGDKSAGELFARRLRDAWSKWSGLYVVSDLEVADALARRGAVTSLSDARQLARDLGAGKLVWGAVPAIGGDPTKIELYDLSADPGSPPRAYGIDQQPNAQSALASSALFLLKDPDRPVTADGGDAGTRNYPAWRSYGAGHIALNKWDLRAATWNFADAVTADPHFAAAHLWLAQVASWTDSTSTWRDHAAYAALGKRALSQRDFLLAEGLAALADRQFPQACASYKALTGIDSADFVAWYGLGECQSRDNLVVRDPSSPSGRRFRIKRCRRISRFTKSTRSIAISWSRDKGICAMISRPQATLRPMSSLRNRCCATTRKRLTT